jgi:hypothetical protein
MPIRSSIAVTLAALISLGVLTLCSAAGAVSRSGAQPTRQLLVYESRRAALDVSITRKGDRIFRAGVSAPSVCSNGETGYAGFGLTGGSGWPIDSAEHFDNKNGIHTVFRGRFEGDKVIGVFYESRLEVGGGTEGFPPRCGNTRPRGRYQHFVAYLVERNGKRVPHPPIRSRPNRRSARDPATSQKSWGAN